MLATGMKTAVEGILSSREARKSALQGLKEGMQTALKGHREALAAEGARQREAWLVLREVQQRSLAHIMADLTQASMEWQRTAQAALAAGPSGKRDYISPWQGPPAAGEKADMSETGVVLLSVQADAGFVETERARELTQRAPPPPGLTEKGESG